MATLQMFDLAKPLMDAEQINSARRTNRLASLLEPYKMREIQRNEQDAVAGQQDNAIKRNAAAARLALGVMGDMTNVQPEEAQQRFSTARRLVADMGVDVSKIPSQFSPDVYRGIQALASQYGEQSGPRVQSTKVDSAGNLLAVMTDGSTRIIGTAENRQQYTPEGLVFDPRGGTISAPGQSSGAPQPQMPQPQAPQGQPQPQQPGGVDLIDQRRREQARLDAEAAAQKAEAEARARQAVEREGATTDRLRATQQTLDDLDRMEQLASSGVYTGGLLDRAGSVLAGAGFAVDQNKANNTKAIMQLATQLKFGAKPPGMGAMTDAEWKIIQDAIPDPRAAGDVGQLLTGIREARRRIVQWRDRQSGVQQQGERQRIRIDAQGNIR